MPINTDAFRAQIDATFAKEDVSAAESQEALRQFLLLQADALDELRTIRLALVRDPVPKDPCADGHHDVADGTSPYCRKCGAQF